MEQVHRCRVYFELSHCAHVGFAQSCEAFSDRCVLSGVPFAVRDHYGGNGALQGRLAIQVDAGAASKSTVVPYLALVFGEVQVHIEIHDDDVALNPLQFFGVLETESFGTRF